ncbi:HAD family hydrolase [Cellulomonas persica]|uniref:Haloacid dehalogenase n=1 Tax=Cellulomonas persica TaxID=76861 RepID=A0A510UW63_9CELL|nr:HAD family hydrolase [Cellulomonas persica]GEK18927.1 haloacid dehalogenase [Cellulomonas persica]
MTRTRLVALDVDGTLMSYDGVVSDGVREAIGGLVDAGVHVVLATGRGVHSAAPVARALGLVEGWLVCSNGAVTARLDDSEPSGFAIVDTVTFDPGPALRAIALELPDALYAVEDLGVGFRVSELFPAGELSGEMAVVGFDELAATPATRVVIRAPGASPEEFHALVERVGLHEVEYAVGWTAWLDLTPGGVSKASALEAVRRRLGVEPFATLAIGDGGNDLQMLEWAARGIAMGHAPERVRGVADEVTGTIDDDGALSVLRGLLA